MITYKEYIKRMEEKGYTYRDHNTIMIDETNNIVKTFTAKKGSVNKILELQCPSNGVISICGKTHDGGCEKSYLCDIKCLDKDNEEPFQESHITTELQHNNHLVAEIVLTKILYHEPPKEHKKIQEWLELINPILKTIGSENPCEHVMWAGAYKLFNTDFINRSFNLYENQRMIFYILNPNIDITNVKFNLKADILEKLV